MTLEPDAQTTPLLEVVDVTFGYDHEIVLDHVSLSVGGTDFLALVGPNGGGKTTLLKLMLGLVKPWRGEVRRNFLVDRGAVGYVPQFSTFDTSFPLRVFDAVLMGRLSRRGLWRAYDAEDRRAASAALEHLRVSGLARAPVAELSGGELQRMLIARALTADPRILLLDEPTAAIDASSEKLLDSILAEVNRRSPVVVVTHDPSGLAERVTRVAHIDRTLTWLSPADLDHLRCHHHLPAREAVDPRADR